MCMHFWLTGARDEGGSGDTTIRAYTRSLGEECFEQRAGTDLDGTEEFNQQAFGFPEPGSTFCGQPITPICLDFLNFAGVGS
jgi:hypothetical protein